MLPIGTKVRVTQPGDHFFEVGDEATITEKLDFLGLVEMRRDDGLLQVLKADQFESLGNVHYPFATSAHKQTDPAKKPGQIVNPIPESMLYKPAQNAKAYKPAHGGYPGEVA